MKSKEKHTDGNKNEPKFYLKGILKYSARGGWLSWLLILVIWQLVSLSYSDYFLPGPISVVRNFGELINNGVLWTDIVFSVERAGKGWITGIVMAVPLGLLIGNYEKVRWLAEPFLNFFRFVPVLALTSLFLMWLGVGEESKIALITYATFFPMLINTIAGVGSTNKILVEAAQCMGASKLRVFLTVVVPSSIPFVFTGIRLGLSGSILCVVAAEMLVANNGLGYLIYSSRLYYKTEWMFVGILTLGVLGFSADRLITFLGRRFLKQYGVK
ncbi:ABC transporter permease [Anaerocolumna xylanovorans]|uniref:NitT/TauT family transport system permease protein n=1 Tax=Anaerocolumna xylanovorans DSM 12503 TaxID=1121345 RepID=A0A1M7Y5K6_9FIRM|nr:ABC transporter permease [Anaerocolumna xylanovorans]SHO47727.1 NitT/TauT family transport system permease protein [Anaerocolumna xylanovorans DSM 12503]